MLIKNTSNVNVTDYPVDFQTYTINAGETKDFPENAASHLLNVYAPWMVKVSTTINEVLPTVTAVTPVEPTQTKEVKPVIEVEATPVVEVKTEENIGNYEGMSYAELSKVYSEKTGYKGKRKPKDDMLFELNKL